MAGTNVPQVQFLPTGVVTPSDAAILTGVQEDIDTAFGGGVNPGLTTPQGQLATSEAAVISDKDGQILLLANNFDPNYAQGRFQDALGAIYFLTRLPPEASVTQCVCGGSPRTPIPDGALASDGTNQWACVGGGQIGAGGTVTLPFACTVTGPIPCPPNSINRLGLIVPGWDTINNPSSGVQGSNVESRADFEHRRQLSVAGNSLSMIQSVVAAVLAVPGVLDAYGYSNDTASPVTKGSVTIPANCMFVCVSGGDPQAVAQAIWTKKMPGCPMYGGTTETVYDTSNGYQPPYPAYSIKFQTATGLDIYVAVTLASTTLVPSNSTALVQAAVQAAFSGADGGPRARIGSTLYASRFYAGVAALGWAQIISIFVGTAPTPTSNDVVVPIDHDPTLQNANITVTLV